MATPDKAHIARKRFSARFQSDFARLSGDYNPMHVDEVVARRFLYGTTVAHGVHVVLQAIETVLSSLPSESRALTHIKARFNGPVVTGSDVGYYVSGTPTEGFRVTAQTDGVQAMDLTFRLAASATEATNRDIADEAFAHDEPQTLTAADFDSPLSGRVELRLAPGPAAELLPAVASQLPAIQIAALLAATRIVGMKCPGYHSIFSELELSFDAGAAGGGELNYAVSGWDERFRLATLEVTGSGIQGRLRAFLRPPPQEQPPIETLRTEVGEDAFAHVRAVVVGGSRGLGEYVAKLLGAGGAHVCVTYHRGADEAAAVVGDMQGAGIDARCMQLDAAEFQSAARDSLSAWQPTHLFYFATPPIYHAGRATFSDEHFVRLSRVYLGGFARLVDSLAGHDDFVYAFCPSTEFLDTLPKGMGEYIAAKAATEALCQYMARRYTSVRFVVPRLPRLATDQTADLIAPAPPPSPANLRQALGL